MTGWGSPHDPSIQHMIDVQVRDTLRQHYDRVR
jgi:hypothetical protein